MHFSGDICNARWTYIRDYYVRRKLKPITGSCSEATTKRSMMLSFLDSFPSQKASTYTNVVASQPGLRQSNELTDPLGDRTLELDPPGEEGQSHVDLEEVETEVLNKPPTKKTKLTHAEERLHLLKELVQHKVAPSDPDETVDLFYRSVAARVKQFSAMDQIKMQCEVSALLANIIEKNSGLESSPSSPAYYNEDLEDKTYTIL